MKMEYRLVTLIVSLLCTVCSSQLIIPKRPLGYIYAQGSNNAAIHLDIHMGPLCPDSRDAFPVAKQGSQIVRKYGGGDGTAYRWFEQIYSNLDMLSNDATANMTTNEVISMLSTVAGKFGVDTMKFKEAMKDDDLETATRAAWKYSCSRAIAGTPTFLLNDVIIEADPTWTLNDWKQVIDRLLQGSNDEANKACPIDTKKCDYLPGKEECCTKGEACIPNVGCRCFLNSCGTRNVREMVNILPIED